MRCPCEDAPKKKQCGSNTPPVLEINSRECPILFHTVVISASEGTPETNPPAIGRYKNVRLIYESNGSQYLYDSDGIVAPLVSGQTNIINGGTVAPTTSTVGTVGTLYSYVDNGTGHLAICTDVSDNTYTWSLLV